MAGADHDRIVRFRNANVAHNAAFGLIHSHLAVKENEDVLVIKHLVTSRCRPRKVETVGRALNTVDDTVIRWLNRLVDELHDGLDKPLRLEEE